MAMSLLSQVLVLVLSYPAVGLLLYALTAVERWALSDQSGGKPRPRHHHAEPSSARHAARSGRSAAA
jgi:hypothetical protein